ncbi:hypothetical protein [Alphaproteobacteria bacterium endosymbiont of Tiliacea citrago]|uniref:hypothetical protein n=1 Tax=Alphaproteobacteria bacterium endosymbiont of Tiliacea citrago TaxID=3077944 RepID=UPI00313EA3CA
MSEQILIYFINFLFIYSIIKGVLKGGTSELVSLIFLVIAFSSAVYVFQSAFYRTIISIFLFISIYIFGLFIAYLMESHSTFEKISGAVIGVVKFFIFLTIITIIALFMDSVPSIYKNNFFVYWIYQPSVDLKDAIEKKYKK